METAHNVAEMAADDGTAEMPVHKPKMSPQIGNRLPLSPVPKVQPRHTQEANPTRPNQTPDATATPPRPCQPNQNSSDPPQVGHSPMRPLLTNTPLKIEHCLIPKTTPPCDV